MTVVALVLAGWLVAAVGVALVFCRAARMGGAGPGPGRPDTAVGSDHGAHRSDAA